MNIYLIKGRKNVAFSFYFFFFWTTIEQQNIGDLFGSAE